MMFQQIMVYPPHYCETALANMDRGDLTGLVLLDLHKAIDTVNHDILLQKLALYRISENTIKWFKSYFNDRCQMVKFQQTMLITTYIEASQVSS